MSLQPPSDQQRDGGNSANIAVGLSVSTSIPTKGDSLIAFIQSEGDPSTKNVSSNGHGDSSKNPTQSNLHHARFTPKSGWRTKSIISSPLERQV
jgi:hypothetical protein